MFDFEKKYIYPYILKQTSRPAIYSTILSMQEGNPSQLPFDIMNDNMSSPSFKTGPAPSFAATDERPDVEHDAMQYTRYKTLSSGGGTVVGFEEAQSMRREAMALSYRNASMGRTSSWSSIRLEGMISTGSHVTSGTLEGVASAGSDFCDTKHNSD